MNNSDGLQRIEALPRGFWKNAAEYESSLEEMVEILELEWKALAQRNQDLLMELNARKQAQIKLTAQRQRQLEKAADTISVAAGGEPGKQRWDSIKAALSAKQLHELETWMHRCRVLQMEIRAMNQRHLQWIDEQLETTRRLLEIFAGKLGVQGLTYDTSGRMSCTCVNSSRAAGF